jgi:hypothetical protein
MIKRFDLILNGKGGGEKHFDCLPSCLNQTLKTAVGRLVLCKPFLATAVVWLDSAARRCELRLRFCVRKTCPALGTKQLSIFMVNHHGKSSGTKASQVDAAADNESEGKVFRNRLNQIKPNGRSKWHFICE